MHKKLQNRLKELKTEFEAGQKRLAELDTQRAGLRETLLRISGSIQVLEEALSENGKHVLVDRKDAKSDEKIEEGSALGEKAAS
ncbi:MAG: hypothetical protein ACE5I1_31420 [bacterium]